MEKLISLLKNKNKTLASCESLTGGLFSSKVVEISGASKVFVGGVVTYATRIKNEIVHVDLNTINKYGVVSSECANEMARNIAELMKSDIGISFTGNAGPDVMDGKPAGLVYSSIYYDGNIYSFEDYLIGERNKVRNEIVELMINRLYNLIIEEN